MPDGFTGSFYLNVQNACFPTLGQNGQGVCGVRLHLEHEYIGDLRITLTSPGGQTVTLIGPVGFFGGTDFTEWDVTFLPCATPAAPDPGFNATWNNNQPWGLNGNYSGTYHPSIGCLENFTGPVNGQWILTVFDQQAIDVGTFFDYEIIFCRPDCIDCFTCAANAGALTQADVTKCEGDPALNLNLPPTYTAPNVAPPASDYDYTYVISQNPGGTIIGYDPGADLSSFTPGSYTVCGLSYLVGDEPLFPAPGTMTTAQLLAQLNSSSPPFCGRVTSNCVNVTINPGVDDITVYKDLCAPQCTTFYGTTYCNTGTYVKNLTQNGCPYKATLVLNVIQPVTINIRDTICESSCSNEPMFPNACAAGVFTRTLPTSQPDQCDTTLRLTVVQLVTNVVIAPPAQLTCVQPTVNLVGTGSSPGTYLWTTTNGHFTSGVNAITATVDEPGTYQLRVCRANPSTGIPCCDSASVTVTEVVSQLQDPTTITGPSTVCQGTAVSFSTPIITGATGYTWTFPPGVTITSGNNTNTVGVNWNNATGGNVCVTATNSCGSSQPFCIPVSVNPSVAAATPQGPTPVCRNSTATYSVPANPNATAYNWTVTGGTIASGQGTNIITVNWGSAASGNVCVVLVGPCGNTLSSCFPVQITPPPATPVVTGQAVGCATGTGTYTISPINGATTYHWQVNNGTINSGNGTTSVNVTWNAGVTNGSVCVRALNTCDSSAQNCFNVTLNAPPPQPVVTGNATLCSGTNGNYSITAIPGSTGYAWTVTGGTIVSGQNTTSIVVNWGAGNGGTVCAAALSTCGTGPQGCFPVTVRALPNANAGNAASTCALTINLQATLSVTGSTGAWTTVSGGTATFANPSSPTSSVTVTAPGQYVFRWTETNGSCVDDATVTITFNSNPVIGQVTTGCENTNVNYTVSFPITGGTPPYSVPGGTITGNTFTSNFIPSGQPYSFTVTDANGCMSQATTGTFNCNCTSDAGQMSLTQLAACEGGSISAQHLGGDTLDGNDVASYILHTNSGTTVGNVLSQNTTGTFSLLPGMSYETVYYVSYVVGNNVGGVPDLTDACTSVAQGQPVIFHQNPVANAGADDETCGLTLTLNGNNGNGAWTVTNAPSLGTITFGSVSTNNTSVTASGYGTYTLTWTLDNSGCTDSDDVVLTFNDSPVAGTVTHTCDPANENYTVTIPITGGQPPYSVNGTAIVGNTFISAPIPNGQNYSYTITDANNCAAPVLTGSFNCDCTSAAGQMSLTQLTACEGESVSAVHLGGETLDGNDVTGYILHTNSGSSLGTVIAQNHTGVFTFQPGMTYGTTYYVSFAVGNDLNGFPNPQDICFSLAQGQPVIFYQNPVADAGQDDSVCGSVITLAAGGQGSGQWTVTGSPTNGGTLTFSNQQSATSSVTASQPGVYTLTWTLTQNGCTDSDDVVLTFNPNPTLANITRTCEPNNENYRVTLTIATGTEPYTVNGTAIAGSVYTSPLIPNNGTYEYTVVDANGCTMPVVSGSFSCLCTTDAGTMAATTLTACDGSTVAAVANADEVLDANDVISYVLHNGTGQALGQVFAQNTTGIFGIQPGMELGVTYYISRVVGNPSNGFPNPQDPCFSVAAGQPVVFLAIPNPNAGNDASVCGQTFNLQATASSFSGAWTQISGTGTATFTDNTDPNSGVTVSIFGTYVFQWTEENGICSDSDQVQIIFNDSPVVNAIDEICNGTNTQYTVTFTVTNGVPPYIASGIAGNFNGNNFTSTALPNNSVYTFTVVDANGCESAEVTGIKNCNCQTDAGTMVTAPIAFCEDEPATAPWNNDATTDADDIVRFILHNQSGSTVGTVYATSDEPTFSFGPGLTLNTTYYISAIAGNDVNGNVDVNDPCLSVANGTPVQWRPLPTATISGTASICEGNTATLTFNGTGTYPLTVTYTNGTANQTVTISNQQGAQVQVEPAATTTYTLVSVASGTNPTCTTVLTQSATITVNPGLSAGTPNDPVEFCEGTALPIQLSNLLTDADPGGTWTEISAVQSLAGGFNAQTGTFFTAGQPAGTYEFRYTRTSIPPCPPDEAVVKVIINPLPVADAGADKQLNCVVQSVSLGGTATSSGSGISYDWRQDTTFIGNGRTVLTSEPGVYTLLVSNSAGCSDSDAAVVTLDDEVPFGVVSSKGVRCWGDKNGSISIDSFATTHPPVLFSLNDGPFTNQTLYTALLPGVYKITLQDANGCEWVKDSILVNEPPQLMLELGANLSVSLGDSVHLEALLNIEFSALDTLYWNPVLDPAKAGTLYQDFLPLTSQYVNLRVIDTSGCAVSDRTLVVVNQERRVYIPNIIKPGSAENDVLTVFGGRDVAEIESFQIFDRWGDQMFQQSAFLPNDVTKGWKGRFRDQDVNPGVYIYTAVVRFIDGERILFKGDVTVMK